MEWTTPLDTLTALLEAASAAHASNLLNAMMRDDLDCGVCIPQSTVVAIRAGTLKWDKPQMAGAFSIFSCSPSSALRWAGNTRYQTDEEDLLTRHLNATEGTGLTEAQNTKASKAIHTIPTSANEMMLHIKSFGGLCCIVFGSESNLTKFVRRILKHTIQF